MRILFYAVFLFAPLFVVAQPAVIESLRDAVIARWEFQTRFPLAKTLFNEQATDADNAKLATQIKAVHPALVADPANPTFSDLWSDFALAMTEEKLNPIESELAYQSVMKISKGNLAVNYELARILTLAGNLTRAHKFQMEVHRSMLEKGYVRLPELAKLELFQAREKIGEGNYSAARQELEFTRRLDPFCPWVPVHLIEIEFREKTFSADLSEVWTEVGEAFRHLRYYDTQSLLLLNISRALRMGLGAFGAMVLLLLFIRHFTRVVHHWAEKLSQDVDLRVRYIALALVPISLAVAGAGYVILNLLGVMFLWRHASRHEKSLLMMILAGMALVPFAQVWEQAMVRHLDTRNGVNLYHRAYIHGFEKPLVDALKAYHPQNREDSLFFTLANSMAYKKQGNYTKAAEYSQDAFKLEPNHPFVVLDKGNLDMVLCDYENAIKDYSTAQLKAEPMTETWFNASQAQLYANNSTLHKKYLDHAADLDAGWVTQFLRDNDENFPIYPPTRKAMDPMLRMGQAWNAALASLMNLDFFMVRMPIGIYIVPGLWFLLAILTTVILLYFRFRNFSAHTHTRDLFECKICGKVMCRLCRKGVHCNTCFKTVSGIHENRLKMDMVTRMRVRASATALRTGAFFNLAIPGTGQIYLGRVVGRFFWTLISCLLLGILWQLNHLVMEYPAFAVGFIRWSPLIPLLFLYLAFNFSLLKSPNKYSDKTTPVMPIKRTVVR